MVSNNKNTSPMPLQQPGAGKPPDISAEGPNELDPAELLNKVDFTVAGALITNMKSLIGVADTSVITEAPLKPKSKSKESNTANNESVGAEDVKAEQERVNNMTAAEKQKRKTRIEIYYEKLHNTIGQANIEALAKKMLQINNPNTVPKMATRKTNFVLFEQRFFKYKTEEYLKSEQAFDDPSFHESPKKGTPIYNLFKEYTETEYGAVLIQRALKQAGKRWFVIQQRDIPFSGTNDTLITPLKLPPLSKRTFSSGGQPIYLLAIIHHEFEHTWIGETKNTLNMIEDERPAVRDFENPVRILNGFEPRYTYTGPDDSKKSPIAVTINIISGERADGKFSYDKNDPSKLIPI